MSRITQGRGVDLVFDAVGGSNFKRSMGLLAYGGSIVTYGAASLAGKKSLLQQLRGYFSFGYYHPLTLMRKSLSIQSVDMFQLSVNRPDLMSLVAFRFQEYLDKDVLEPIPVTIFSNQELMKAHEILEK